jgi:hypothetical protein
MFFLLGNAWGVRLDVAAKACRHLPRVCDIALRTGLARPRAVVMRPWAVRMQFAEPAGALTAYAGLVGLVAHRHLQCSSEYRSTFPLMSIRISRGWGALRLLFRRVGRSS